MRRLANYAYSIITAFATIVTVIGFIISPSWKTWAKTHSEWVFYAFLAFLLAAAVSLNRFDQERKEQSKRYRQLNEKYQKLVADQAKPSEHDIKIFRDLMGIIPPEGPDIEWLRESSTPNAFPVKTREAVRAALKNMRLRTIGFDNSRVEAGYNQLREALQEFEDATSQYIRSEPSNPWLQRPESGGGKAGSAVAEITEVRPRLLEKYTNFLDLAHQNGIDW